MAFINEWIINIIVFMLLAMIVDMLLPSSNMKKYTKLVIGLLLIAIITTPLFKIMKLDVDDIVNSFTVNANENEQAQLNLLKKKENEIQASQHAYILKQMAVQMKAEVEKELMAEHGMTITNIEISAGQDLEPTIEQLNHVKVYVKAAEEETAAVQPVNINIAEQPNKVYSQDYTNIAAALAKSWDMPISKIEIAATGEEPIKDE